MGVMYCSSDYIKMKVLRNYLNMLSSSSKQNVK